METPRVLCNYLGETFLSLAYRVAAVAQTGRPDKKEDEERKALYQCLIAYFKGVSSGWVSAFIETCFHHTRRVSKAQPSMLLSLESV